MYHRFCISKNLCFHCHNNNNNNDNINSQYGQTLVSFPVCLFDRFGGDHCGNRS